MKENSLKCKTNREKQEKKYTVNISGCCQRIQDEDTHENVLISLR